MVARRREEKLKLREAMLGEVGGSGGGGRAAGKRGSTLGHGLGAFWVVGIGSRMLSFKLAPGDRRGGHGEEGMGPALRPRCGGLSATFPKDGAPAGGGEWRGSGSGGAPAGDYRCQMVQGLLRQRSIWGIWHFFRQAAAFLWPGLQSPADRGDAAWSGAVENRC
jgi:hypothetical protein